MLAFLLLAAAMPGRAALGQYGRWGAFRESAPLHCFAIAEPVGGRKDGARPYLAISSWPEQRIAAQLHVRLRGSVPGARVTLRIGALAVPLTAGPAGAWAHDGREDVRIVAAMRRGGQLTIESHDAAGRRHADRYPLADAAAAIDAAAVGCLR